ncbi:MAG: ATP-binding protein [Prevotella sp.]|nr:ATP-binding protein [Bacteroidales bacterium]MDY4230032.1 ATP-binding protein [Prevotella sp.]
MNYRRFSVGQRLYLSVMAVFLLFTAGFIVFQQMRERQYKVELFNTRLQDFNRLLYVDLLKDSVVSDSQLQAYVKQRGAKGLRLTLIRPNGQVVFDNIRKDYANFSNHANRPEVRQALTKGQGYTVDRSSKTLKGYYFYSATYLKKPNVVVRSAMPYDNNLVRTLSADSHFLWFALLAIAILTWVLYRFTHRLGQNITNLQTFAKRVDHNESVDTEDLVEFPNDELGEIAERIIKLYKKLQSTQKEQDILKRQLTQNVAHELKTPVASIQGYLETLINNPQAPEATKKQFIDRCYAQSQRLTSLLRDISTLNRIDDAPDLMGTSELVDIAELVKGIENDVHLQLQERGMTFCNQLPERVAVHGNRSLLYSVFRNLTDNAINYAGENTTITLRAELDEDDSIAGLPQRWRFTFSDNGIGVSPEHLPRLFERFYRVDKGRSRKMGGTGLGLAIVKNAVLLHGGTISVDNNPNGGLCFHFTLSE